VYHELQAELFGLSEANGVVGVLADELHLGVGGDGLEQDVHPVHGQQTHVQAPHGLLHLRRRRLQPAGDDDCATHVATTTFVPREHH
jgi:hypothetical protein